MVSPIIQGDTEAAAQPETYTFDVSVVIVSFNTREVLRECLRSIERESNGLRVEVLVVDNNSADGSQEMIRNDFPLYRLIESKVNLGFASANNLAVQAARGRHLVLLNSDAFLCANSLRIAVEQMDKTPAAGLAGGRLIGRDLSWQPSARMFPNLLTDLFVFTGLAYRYPKSRIFGRFDRTWANPTLPAEVDWVPGAFSIIRAEALARVGSFDPTFFLYSEEVDLCRRIKNAGYQIWYWPEIVVIHVGGESSRQMRDLEISSSGSQLIVWRMRSTLLYYRKHHGAAAWFAKQMELALFRLFAWRNTLSSNPRRKLLAGQNRNLIGCMQQAWKDTKGGRVSPPLPW